MSELGSLIGPALEGAHTRDEHGVEVVADYGDPEGEHRALHEGVGVVDRSNRGVVVVRGADAATYLQDMVSQGVTGVGDGGGARSLMLQPTGKLDVEFRLLRVGDAYWLDCEPGLGDRLAEALLRYRLRVDVEVSDESDLWGVVSVRGPRADEVSTAALGVAAPARSFDHVAWRSARVVRADWPGFSGVEVIGPGPDLVGAWEAIRDAGAVPVGGDAFERARIEAGVPRQGRDLDERTIAQEARLERDAIDFSKGCFLGQELVRRIEDRGHVNRFLRRLELAADITPPPGADVLLDDQLVGTLTSVAPPLGDDAPMALGYVRAQVARGDTVTVRWDGGEVTARVEELPAAA